MTVEIGVTRVRITDTRLKGKEGTVVGVNEKGLDEPRYLVDHGETVCVWLRKDQLQFLS